MKYLGFLLGIVLVMVNVIVAPTGLHAQEDDNTGTWLYFVSYHEGNGEIYRMRPDGSNQQNLTNDPANDGTSIDVTVLMTSPDMAWLYFTSNRDGDLDIYRMRPDGSDVENLTNNDAYDGFSTTPSAYWSPDGQWLAFESDRDGNSELYIMRPDGSEPQNMSLSSCFDLFGGWVPNGEAIEVFANCNFDYTTYLTPLDPNMGQVHLVEYGENFGYSLAWTTDSTSFLYLHTLATGGEALYRYTPSTDTTEELFIAPDIFPHDYHDGWQYFSSTEDNWRYMYRVNATSGEVEKLLDMQGHATFTSVIDDTVYFRYQPAAREFEADIYAVSPDGSVQQVATVPYAEIGISQFIIDDWLYISVYNQALQQSDIHRVNLTSQAVEQLTHSDEASFSASNVMVVLTILTID